MIVFGILAHQDPAHLARLVDRLAPYPAIVHLDKKSDRIPFDQALAHTSNALLIPRSESFDVRWAGMSVVRAELAILERARELAAPDDYIVLLSGADYPLRPVAELDSHLASSEGTQFIRYFKIMESSDHLKWSVTSRHYNDFLPLGRPRNTLHRKANTAIRLAAGRLMSAFRPPLIPQWLEPVFGSQFFALTRACVDEILALRTEQLDRFFTNVYSPDEMYFHSLVALSSYHDKTSERGYAPVPLRDAATVAWMANLHHLAPISKWFTISDWPEISESDRWFIRKVRTSDGTSLLDRIDRARLGGVSPPAVDR